MTTYVLATLASAGSYAMLGRIATILVTLGANFSYKADTLFVDCDCEATFLSYKRQVVKAVRIPL